MMIATTSHKGQNWAIVILSILLAGMIALTIYFGIKKSRCENKSGNASDESGARVVVSDGSGRDPRWPSLPDWLPPMMP
ncbi:MAG: hypothetical protein K0U52_03705 [Gammaproteobacteria bacterium]|nr:hypothetical protein [Gammaproteobacteria bacterium]